MYYLYKAEVPQPIITTHVWKEFARPGTICLGR